MDIENLLPKEATVEKIGLSLQGIFDDIRGLSKEELLSHPREYVLNDKIDVKILKEIRKLPVECSIAGEKDRLVFATGSVLNTEILNLKDRLQYLPKNYPTNSRRYAKAKYSMHSHCDLENNDDAELGRVPSIDDLMWFKDSQNDSSIIFTDKGLVEYTYDKNTSDLEFEWNYPWFVLDKLALHSIMPRGRRVGPEETYAIIYKNLSGKTKKE